MFLADACILWREAVHQVGRYVFYQTPHKTHTAVVTGIYHNILSYIISVNVNILQSQHIYVFMIKHESRGSLGNWVFVAADHDNDHEQIICKFVYRLD